VLSFLLLLLLTQPPSATPAVAGDEVHSAQVAGLQEPEDPGRVLNLLDGLVDKVQESSPFLATIIRFLGFLVWLFLHIKVWGPSLLVTALLVGGFLVWQGRKKKQADAPAQKKAEEMADEET
jgi:hypothetical protein